MSRISRPKKIQATSAPTLTVHDRIRAAEKSLLSGQTARVLVSESDLEKIAELISNTGQTYAQILKKAVHLGVAVLQFPASTEATAPDTTPVVSYEAHEEETLGGWTRMDPIPYAGFELRRPAGRHDIPVEEPAPEVAQEPTA
jgi:hypothetical protein